MIKINSITKLVLISCTDFAVIFKNIVIMQISKSKMITKTKIKKTIKKTPQQQSKTPKSYIYTLLTFKKKPMFSLH